MNGWAATVTPLIGETLLQTFLLFCRIGGCLMLAPGFSSSRIPVQVRLLFAIALTLALSPLLLSGLPAPPGAPAALALVIISEVVTGAVFGLMARFFFLALQFLTTAAITAIGFGGLLGGIAEETEASMAPVTLITVTATLLFFLTDQHFQLIRGLLASYAAVPFAAAMDMPIALNGLVAALTAGCLIALQVCAPFLVFSLIINLLVGIANKLTPQIPVYFISIPFTMAGGLFVLYLVTAEALKLFNAAFDGWLAAQ